MSDLILARALHVLAIVIWIGGVCMVTTVLLPTIRKNFSSSERLSIFHRIESRFATQARFTTLIAGLSGFYMVWRMQIWNRFEHIEFWWMHAMFLVWLIFTTMLFVIEPFILNKKLGDSGQQQPDKVYVKVQRLHWFLLTISFITIIGAVMGSHGFAFF
ncbi:hypothetical protein H3T59_01905 [Commensalibacter sp. M0357]|uniref:hypothetical protein n=1 Tax=Commensalibacter TaxID=1079922 RepID=UPI0012D9680A|nr:MULTISPECIES: hypothetical protein [Commensalibacter]MBI0074380.1 hypothetical protein [Commensalibacter sp. M0357]MBI0084221.1 hypothetical protein [Commensalibacter sp. M0355]MUG78020.1 hypothetical protein [Commensalibacter melissae]